jgi:hypothetical protein
MKEKDQGRDSRRFRRPKNDIEISIVVYSMRISRPMGENREIATVKTPQRGPLISMHACIVSVNRTERFVNSICDEAVS